MDEHPIISFNLPTKSADIIEYYFNDYLVLSIKSTILVPVTLSMN